MAHVKIFPSQYFLRKLFSNQVYQFYVRMVILEHSQMTATLCHTYIDLKSPKYIYVANICKSVPECNRFQHQP